MNLLPSLPNRLLRHVIVPLALTWLLGVLIALAVARYFTQQAFDRALLDDAYAVAAHVQSTRDGGLTLGLTAAEMRTLLFDQDEAMYFAVYLEDGHLLVGHPGLGIPAPPETTRPYFAEAVFYNQNLRVVVVSRQRPAPFKVVVGQTTRSRASQFDRLLLFSIAPQLLLLLLLAWWLRRTIQDEMRPLTDLEGLLAQRDARDLTPVSLRPRTRELQRLVQAVNELLARVGRMTRSQKEFAGNVAHELRTPLAGIRALAEYGLGHQEPEVWREQLSSIVRSQQSASHLVDQLLALALAQEAREVLRPGPLRLDVVAREVLLRHLPRADALGVDLGGLGLDSPCAVQAQRALIEGGLDNLIDNALRYGRPPNGRIPRVTVEIAKDVDGTVVLSVVDNGPGIDAQERERLLSRWAQGPDGHAQGLGSGLGLAIVVEYARILGATFSLGSGEDGLGLRVNLCFQPSTG